jgi:hypothetical protein
VNKDALIYAPTLEHKHGQALPIRNGLAMSPFKLAVHGREYRVFYRLIVRLPSGEKEITLD